MKLILISGGKHSHKDRVASELASNSDCIWIKPYTDRTNESIIGGHDFDEYIHLNETQLNHKMSREVPLAETIVNSHRYVFFENQLRADFVVMIADDRIITYLKNNWDGNLITVKCHSKDETQSGRHLLEDKDFDIVFNVDKDDMDTLIALIEDVNDFKG